MKNMKKLKFSKTFINDVERSLNMIDLHCEWCGLLKPEYKNKIGFDDDPKGNGKGPYLELTFYKTYAKFTKGTHLTEEEKELEFWYEDFYTIDGYADKLGRFIINYFKSIRVEYIRD